MNKSSDKENKPKKRETKKKAVKTSELSQLQKEAEAAGMSYGQYVAMKGR